MAYMTKQRKIMLNFFGRRPHEVFSVTQLIEEFREERISASAIYRNLAELASAGEIEKVSRAGTREACYQYINAEACQNQIHMVCSVCKKAVHMNVGITETLMQQLLLHENFQMDKNKTTIIGICKNCRQDTEW